MRILALWDYARPNWVAPLEGLVARGHEVIYLAYRSQEREPARTGIPDERERHFWNEFRSAQQALRRIKPDRVVLMGTEGAWAISTIAAARRLKIPTVLLQHGVFGPLESWVKLSANVRLLITAKWYERLPAVLFLSRSFLTEPRELTAALRYLRASATSTAWEAAPLHPLESRRADLYFVASERAKQFHRAMDHVDENRFVAVGLSEFDDLVTQHAGEYQSGHVVLIDTPHTGTPHMAESMTGEEKSALISHIASDLADHGWRLTVKLHPASYRDTWPINGPGLAYVREVELSSLIGSATVLLGFDSTLFAASLLHRPGIFLTLDGSDSWLTDLAVELGAAGPPIEISQLKTNHVALTAECAEDTASGRLRLVEALIGPPDGRSLERLEQALRQAKVIKAQAETRNRGLARLRNIRSHGTQAAGA